MRLDVYLTENKIAPSRHRAAEMIKGCAVEVDGKIVCKPSFDVEGKTVRIVGEDIPYVSRGGLKLKGALDAFFMDVKGFTCLDIGASTGGFTDCLLQHGARKVYAVDVGSEQLHEKLRSDSRVVSFENYNARGMKKSDFPDTIDLAVSDLSFISQGLIYQPLSEVLPDGAYFISLIKPQFEAGRQALNKKGIVKDLKIHLKVMEELTHRARLSGLYMKKICPSPIEGGDGNREYLALFLHAKTPQETVTAEQMRRIVFKEE